MDNKIIKLNNNSENRSIIENLNIDDSYYDSITQSQIIIDGDNNNDVYKKILKQIQSKINGYKNQDKKEDFFSSDKFVDIDFILNLFKETNSNVIIANNVKILYKLVRESSHNGVLNVLIMNLVIIKIMLLLLVLIAILKKNYVS